MLKTNVGIILEILNFPHLPGDIDTAGDTAGDSGGAGNTAGDSVRRAEARNRGDDVVIYPPSKRVNLQGIRSTETP